MKGRRILGIALIIVGLFMVLFSGYIANQVAEGKVEIQNAESKVNTVDTLFKQSEYTKPIGKIFTNSAQKKINEGQAQIDYYQSVSNKLKIGGLILVAIGAFTLFISRKGKK